MTESTQDLSRFAIPGLVAVERGPSGHARLKITTPAAEALVYLHGAHVASYLPQGFADLLWGDPTRFLDKHGGISGGIPVCWPWFARHPSDPRATFHGFARISEWTLLS